MCLSYPTSVPSAPAAPPATPPAQELPDQGTASLGNQARNQAIEAVGSGTTVLTGPDGLTSPSTASEKTLLGS